MLETLAKMPRQYIWLLTTYFFFLIVDIAYFFIPGIGFGLYADPYMILFTLYSLVPSAILFLELGGGIDDEHYGFVRNVNYLLMIFFIMVSAIFIVPVIAV